MQKVQEKSFIPGILEDYEIEEIVDDPDSLSIPYLKGKRPELKILTDHNKSDGPHRTNTLNRMGTNESVLSKKSSGGLFSGFFRPGPSNPNEPRGSVKSASSKKTRFGIPSFPLVLLLTFSQFRKCIYP